MMHLVHVAHEAANLTFNFSCYFDFDSRRYQGMFIIRQECEDSRNDFTVSFSNTDTRA